MHLAPGTVIMTLDSPHSPAGLLGVVHETISFPSLFKASKDYYYSCLCNKLGKVHLSEEEIQVVCEPETIEIGKTVRFIGVEEIGEGIIVGEIGTDTWVNINIAGETNMIHRWNIIPKFISNKSSKNLLDKEW